jgi:TonB family protein
VASSKASPAASSRAKASSSPSAKGSSSSDAKLAKSTEGASKQTAGGSASQSGGAGGSSQFGWYHELIHDRFYSQWDQPTSIFDSSKSFVCTLQVRIEADGKIADIKVLKSSGNVIMDDSVVAAAHRVVQIDPPPADLSKGGAYTVNINFELQ